MSNSKYIDTDDYSEKLRLKAINLEEKRISVTNLRDTEQEKDLREAANCDGFGRIRHFKLDRGDEWPRNPLPMVPAAKALGIDPMNEMRAQVFQNSVCNWRCWYCYVDFKLLAGSPRYSSFKSCIELLELFKDLPDRPHMIDLTGGQPDLTPEWVPWMMEALVDLGLDREIYLWSDDNLSNDFFWKYLTSDQINLIQKYEKYGRVCCFKGIDEHSFSLNTAASPELFQRQLQLAKRLMELDIDLYFYITLTAPTTTDFKAVIPKFLDDLQSLHTNLPLRTVPLQVLKFTPLESRMNVERNDLIEGQYKAIEVWKEELEARYSPEMLQLPIDSVPL